MIKHIIIAHLYKPGSAATNRIIAFAKGYREAGLKVSLVLGCMCKETNPTLPDIDVSPVFAKRHTGLNKGIAEEVKRIYTGETCAIQIYGSPALCFYLPKTRYNIFYECTEVPYYGRQKTLKSWIKETIKSWLTKQATGVMVISKALKHYFEKAGIKHVAIINMFVDTSRFTNVEAQMGGGNFIAYCGKVSFHKDGVDDLIKAFALLHEWTPDYKLWIIGGFENKETEIRLKEMVGQKALTEAVKFFGPVNPNDMPGLLKSARILALARPNNEQAKYGFPTKLGEYLATGKPVVVTRVGEIADFLADKTNCIFASPDNPEDFAEKLNWVVSNYDEATKIGLRGKLLTESEFSSTEQCKRAIEFMNSTLACDSV